MIFKVFYQDSVREVPVREKTKVLYVEGTSEMDVRIKLKNKAFNIELVQGLSPAHLEYEQQSPNFVIAELD